MQLRIAETVDALHLLSLLWESYLMFFRLKKERICVSTDGPWENVVKFKPPMCFSMEDAELVAHSIDHILTG